MQFTHWALFTVYMAPVDAVDGRCGMLQLLGRAGWRRLQTNARSTVTCMHAAHACSLTLPHCHNQSQHTDKHPSPQSIQSCWLCPRVRNQKHAGAAQHNAQAAACDNLKRFQGSKWLINISCCRSECRALQASTVVQRGEVKRSEDQTSTVLIVIRGLRGQERERCTQPQPEITKGRADGLESQLLYYTHSALDARTYCFTRRSSKIGIARAERGKQYMIISTHNNLLIAPHFALLPS